MKIHNLIKFSLIGLTISSCYSFAQDEIEVIQVKGDFRQSTVNNSALSLSVLNQSALNRTANNHLEDVISAAANVNFNGGSSRARFFQIRGLGAQSEFDAPVNYPVGIYIDDVDFSQIGSGATLFDIEQVEIFRGPQGTRFGANAMAGLIYLTSTQPSSSPSGKIKFSKANYNTQEFGVAVGNRINKQANFRLSAHRYTSDGFIENAYLKQDDTNNRDEMTLRGKLSIEMPQQGQLDLSYIHVNMDNGYDTFSLDNTRQTLSDQPGKDTQQTNAYSVQYKKPLNSAIKLHSIVSYAHSDTLYQYDEDWAYEGIHPDGYSSVDSYAHDKTNASLELRLLSHQEKILNNSTQWVTGIYLQESKDKLVRDYTYSDLFTSDFNNQKGAIFAQSDSQLNDDLSLTIGLRYEIHKMDYRNSQQLNITPDYEMWGGKLALAYQLSSDTFAFASINRGYMRGGINYNGTLSDAQRYYTPEYLWNYEAGFKYRHNNFAFNLTAFYMDREDIQLNKYFEVERADGSTEFISFTRNAQGGYSTGLEAELNWYASDVLHLYASFGQLRAISERYTVPSSGQTFAERTLSQSPDYSYQLGANLNLTQDIWFNIEAIGKDSYYFSDDSDNDVQADKRNLVNAALNYQNNNLLVKLWARNIFDQDYYVQGFNFGNDPRDGYQSKFYYQYGEPARLGLTLEYSY
ncbi:TonB-dependent receptor [Catenovulum sediminis]|uniref:TonB-dependent receptor n=1 Tax=Catenovulum sediminis TaxID=1740262 RepID=A0ABV1REQ5_9ALTE